MNFTTRILSLNVLTDHSLCIKILDIVTMSILTEWNEIPRKTMYKKRQKKTITYVFE